jgi:hypothetical protein
MARNDSEFGQVRHWLATNLSVKDDGQLDIPEDSLSPYIGPAPLPNYMYVGLLHSPSAQTLTMCSKPRPHRYVFILSRPRGSGTDSISVEKEDLTALQQNFPAAFEGSQEVQDLKDRWGFHAEKLMAKKKLEPVAATFMLVGGTLKSAAANAGMTVEAGVNKVLGK